MQIVLGYAAVDAALAAVAAVVAELADSRATASREVGLLLDGGWAGAAASAFDEAWQEWLAGEEQVRASLAGLHDAIAATRRDLATTDAVSAAGVDRLASRLGP
jgi:WXG100 family type VII secretion target